MGLLTEGSPLSWEETKKHADHVRKHGIIQFINQYNRLKERKCDDLKWGDEVEYTLVHLDHEKKQARVSLHGTPVLQTLQEKENANPDSERPTTWRVEYAEYMVEGSPGKPYGHRMAHFNMVEANMKVRRNEVEKLLRPGETALSVTAFPRLGCPNFTEPIHQPTPNAGASHSLFYPEEAICGVHPRFKTLTRNIRQRRGEKVAMNIPIYKDKNTKSPFIEDYVPLGDDGEAKRAALPDHIYLDCMGFGMGCSCLQMTFQACNVPEARHLYDQLTPLTPIVLALSAATPVLRGLLSDSDCRWNIIAGSVDDRTREERGLEPLKENRFVINKSRYDSIDSYLSPCDEKHNDINLVYDKEIYKTLRDSGIDHLLSLHMAHLFIRDPVALFGEKIDQDDTTDTDHFENIQSTNWQTMRFKPPPPNSDIGWRVEFRPVEVQLTDFENAAFTTFVVLMTRAILSFKLDFVIPISKVDENMKVAQQRDAVLNGKFYFRKDITTDCSPPAAEAACSDCCKTSEDAQVIQLTVNEIINGKANEFPGLIPLIKTYVNSMDDCDVDTGCTIEQYLNLIRKRATGELKTTARWMRDFVMAHPEYKQDSVVNERINYDLMVKCTEITRGEPCPDLLPCYNTRTSEDIPIAMQKADEYLDHKVHARNGHDHANGTHKTNNP